VEVSPRDGL